MGFKDAGKPHYLGHRERLRRRFRDGGADPIPDYQLLELILSGRSPTAILSPSPQFGTFAEEMNAPDKPAETAVGTILFVIQQV